MIKAAKSLRHSDPGRLQRRAPVESGDPTGTAVPAASPHQESQMESFTREPDRSSAGQEQRGFTAEPSRQTDSQDPHSTRVEAAQEQYSSESVEPVQEKTWNSAALPIQQGSRRQSQRISTDHPYTSADKVQADFTRRNPNYRSTSMDPAAYDYRYSESDPRSQNTRWSGTRPGAQGVNAPTLGGETVRASDEDPFRRSSTWPLADTQHTYRPFTASEHAENLRVYRDLVGLTTPPELSHTKARTSIRSYMCFTRPVKNKGYYQSIIDAELRATIWYHTSTWAINILLALQIGIAASLTALGVSATGAGGSGFGTAITVLGAVNTAVATTLAYLKAKGLPMRVLVYRNDLRRLRQDIEYTERQFLLGIRAGATMDPAAAAAGVKARYLQVEKKQEVAEKVDEKQQSAVAADASTLAAHPVHVSPSTADTSLPNPFVSGAGVGRASSVGNPGAAGVATGATSAVTGAPAMSALPMAAVSPRAGDGVHHMV